VHRSETRTACGCCLGRERSPFFGLTMTPCDDVALVLVV
jgi:hypothetical protein